jgi:hypothetical protein
MPLRKGMAMRNVASCSFIVLSRGLGWMGCGFPSADRRFWRSLYLYHFYLLVSCASLTLLRAYVHSASIGIQRNPCRRVEWRSKLSPRSSSAYLKVYGTGAWHAAATAIGACSPSSSSQLCPALSSTQPRRVWSGSRNAIDEREVYTRLSFVVLSA